MGAAFAGLPLLLAIFSKCHFYFRTFSLWRNLRVSVRVLSAMRETFELEASALAPAAILRSREQKLRKKSRRCETHKDMEADVPPTPKPTYCLLGCSIRLPRSPEGGRPQTGSHLRACGANLRFGLESSLHPYDNLLFRAPKPATPDLSRTCFMVSKILSNLFLTLRPCV